MYPQCLSLLELLQHEQFLKEIVNAQCSKFIDEQLLLIWSTYKKKRDWSQRPAERSRRSRRLHVQQQHGGCYHSDRSPDLLGLGDAA
jgi:mediator of RNA polymerase II transcription subunit 31